MFTYDHIALNVSDLNKSKNFYLNLGGKVVSKPSLRFVEILFGGHRLHLVEDKDGANTTGGIDHFAVAVEDDKVLERVCGYLNVCPDVQNWAPFNIVPSPTIDLKEHVEERPPFKTLYAKDPDGITIEIRCYGKVEKTG